MTGLLQEDGLGWEWDFSLCKQALQSFTPAVFYAQPRLYFWHSFSSAPTGFSSSNSCFSPSLLHYWHVKTGSPCLPWEDMGQQHGMATAGMDWADFLLQGGRRGGGGAFSLLPSFTFFCFCTPSPHPRRPLGLGPSQTVPPLLPCIHTGLDCFQA